MDRDGDREAARAEAERFVTLLTDDEFGSLLYIRRDRSQQARVYSRIVARAIEAVREALRTGES